MIEAAKKPKPQVTSTAKGKNRFKMPLFLRVEKNGTLVPVDHYKKAHYKCVLIGEYPTYELELSIKRDSTLWDDVRQHQWLDMDKVIEMRIRKCLVSWNLHEKIPELELQPLFREQGSLADDSLDAWKSLPPLVRKAIVNLLFEALGTV